MAGKLLLWMKFKGWMAFYACVEGGAGLHLVNKGQIRGVEMPKNVEGGCIQFTAHESYDEAGRNGRSVTEAGAMASFAKGKSTVVVRSVDGDAGILIARAGKYGFGSRTALSLARVLVVLTRELACMESYYNSIWIVRLYFV